MELELKKVSFDTYDTNGELTLTQEETAETIVPDYCPDIARIIDTEGAVFLHSREVRDGKAEVSGTVRICVLYTPDGESGIRTLEFAIPFSAETEGKAMPECVCLCAEAEIEFLETRLLNPRKVFTRCKLVIRLSGYRKAPVSFCTDAADRQELGLEKRQEQQHASFLMHIAEKDFTFSDEMDLSPGREGAAEILTSRIDSSVTETKVVGSKFILKGIFSISLLYRTQSGSFNAFSGELAFSQILEVEGASESSATQVRLQLTGSDFQLAEGGDGRKIAVTLYLHATAFLREERELLLLSDLYSTAYDLNYEASPVLLTDLSGTMTRRQTMREILEIGVVASSILSLYVSCGAVSITREGESVTLRTAAAIRALYLDEGGAALLAERSVEVSSTLEIPEGCKISARANCVEEAQGSLGDRGIEVRFQVEFSIQALTQKKRVCISSVKVNTDAPKDFSGAPSLVLRGLRQEETVWDLAKQYSTTIPEILSANELEEETAIPRDQLLLIPRKRA